MPAIPTSLGFRMPAEWEPHEATWLAWPHHKDDWPRKFGAIPWVYTEIVRHLHKGEKVRLLVQNDRADQEARHILSLAGIDLDHIESFPFRTNRVWTRDSGPLFVKNAAGEVAITDWKFNAWAKYPNWKQDDKLPNQIALALDLPSWQPKVNSKRVVLEGGSIDVNGQGLLLTTEECLLGEIQQRNPCLSRNDLEKVLADYLGIQKVLWLNRGIAGDDTHGHVDDLARFVGLGTVVTVVESSPTDENYQPLQENLERLRGMTDLEGQPLEVIPIPMPAPVYWENTRLPASYANFYIANTCVLVPTFNDPKDRVALGILGELFPSREVIGIHAVDLVWGLGTLHCMTQQQPK
jgi:agmatine deiminase